MRSLRFLILLLLVATATGLAAQTSDLFFSEYIEGGSFNKAFEVFNPTASTVSLADYRLVLGSNGNAQSQTYTFTGGETLASYDVFVICHASADGAILAVADATSSSLCNHNGDDAVILQKSIDGTWTTIDVIGEPGDDPGSYWNVNGVNTKDKTLVRKSTISHGNPVALGSFGTDASNCEWDVYPRDDLTHIGAHTYDGGGVVEPDPSITVTAPNGGEAWVQNTTQSITWAVANFTVAVDVDIILTDASDATISTIATNIGSSPYSWSVGNTAAGTYKIKVQDTATGTVSDLSDATFTISEEQSGTTVTIDSEDFDACTNTGTFDSNYTSSLGSAGWSVYDASGSENWEINSYGGTYYAQCSGYNSTGNCDDWLISPAIDFSSYESETFSFDSIAGYQSQDFFPTLLISNNYTSGDPSTATWNEITGATWNDHTGSGYGDWSTSGNINLTGTIGDHDYSDDTNVRIAIRYNATSGQTTTWEIDNLTITGTGQAPDPTVAVTAPNGGESWFQNSTHNVSWSSANYDGTVDVILVNDSGNVATLATAQDANGTYEWAIGNTAIATNYKIKVQLSGDSSIYDESDATFTIAEEFQLEDDLFFSEYIEGSSNNKAIEIYNPFTTAVDLGNYRIVSSHNGSGWETATDYIHTFATGTMLAAGDVWVIANSDATVFAAAVIDESVIYNDDKTCAFTGDDARALQKNVSGAWVNVDVFGDPDNDPGSAWPVGGVSGATTNHTLIRKSTVVSGNVDTLGSFGTSEDNSEWIVAEQDYADGLGSHTYGADTTAPTMVSVSVIDATTIQITFDESVEETTSELAINYTLTNTSTGSVNIVSVARDDTDFSIVTLTVASLASGSYAVSCEGVEDLSGNEMNWAELTFSYNAPADPDAPTGLSIVIDGNNVVVSWNAADNATSYKVYRSATPDGTFNEVTTGTLTDTSFTDAGAATTGSWFYQVTAAN